MADNKQLPHEIFSGFSDEAIRNFIEQNQTKSYQQKKSAKFSAATRMNRNRNNILPTTLTTTIIRKIVLLGIAF